MPLIVIKDFSWRQTLDKVIIHVPIKCVNKNKVDIFSSERYIKASSDKYYFDAVLLELTNLEQSKCVKTDTELVFELEKVEKKLWDTLEIQLPRQEKLELKKKFIQEAHEKYQEQCKKQINKKAELKRVAVREQIALDTKTRENIEQTRKLEETKALGDLNNWKQKQLTQIKRSENVTHKPEKLPNLRSTRSLQVLFTPREFVTPSRESKLEEENEWLRKQAEARRSAGFISEDIRPEERNPQFLKGKGDEFMKTKNYLGALSAYSFGIKLSNKFVDLYIARLEAHLALENFSRVIEDASAALELLKPAVPINLDLRALCIARRGIGLYKLGFFKQGISELQASLKLKFDAAVEQHLLEADAKMKSTKELNESDTSTSKD